MNQSPAQRGLRAVRRVLAGAIASAVAAFPSLEPVVIKLGRPSSRRSRLRAGLFWVVQEHLLARLRTRGEPFRPVHVRGRRLQLDITDSTGRFPYFYGTPYEPAVTDAIMTALRPGDVFIDIGANIGYFSVLAAQIVGTRGRVIAFEPHSDARERLDLLVQRNEVNAVVDIVPIALAEADGDAAFFVEDGMTAHSTIEPTLSPMRHVAAFRPAGVVPVTTLDGWIAGHPGLAGRVRCIKIDVEGAEARVLAGMTAMLRSRSLTILCETATASPADRALAAAGFERKRIEPGTGAYGNFLYVRP